MSNFLRVVRMISAYKGLAGLVIFFDILSVIFSLFSLTMVVPLLGVLFGIQPLVMEKPTLSLNPNGLIDRFYYEISRVILDGAGEVTLDGQMRALLLICGFVVVTFLLKNLFRYMALFFSAPLKNAVVRDIRNSIFRKVLSLPLAYFSEEKKGEIVAKMTSDVQEVENSVMSSVEVVFKEPFTIIFFLGTLGGVEPRTDGIRIDTAAAHRSDHRSRGQEPQEVQQEGAGSDGRAAVEHDRGTFGPSHHQGVQRHRDLL
jgi:ATP-binding cassette, subfamily B, bacterial MsbA